MKQESLKSKFTVLLKRYIKRKKIKQLEIAERLGITPSAVCQMIKSRIAMNLHQLSVMNKILKLSSDEASELQTLLLKIRNGGDSFKTPFNKLIRTLRRKNGFNINTLSIASGISRIRLRSFEDNFEMDFTPDDAARLSDLFKCPAEDLLKLAPDPEKYEIDAEELSEVAENESSYDVENNFPMIKLEDFCNYTSRRVLKEFAMNYAFGSFANMSSAKDSIAVIGNGEDLELSITGEVIMIIPTDKNAAVTTHIFALMDARNVLHIVEQRSERSLYKLLPRGKSQKFEGDIKWLLPIDEIIIRPCPIIKTR